MPKPKGEYYAVTTRAMLREAKIIGRVPFILFQYYLTFLTASEIRPPLQMICEDLGMEKPAVCNARAILKNNDWIDYDGDRVKITKTFILNESRSSDMNDLSFKMNERSSDMNGTEVALKEDLKELTKEHTEVLSGDPRGNGKPTNGIPLTDILNLDPDAYTSRACDILQEKNMVTPFNHKDWLLTIEYTKKIDPDPERFGGCIDQIKTWARARITPEMVANNFGKFLEEKGFAKNNGKPNICGDCETTNGLIPAEGDTWQQCKHGGI